MPQKIHILSEKLCNQIAAGEVVERPASVVKELVENALDAGATTIIVEVEQGGKRLVRVTDNGIGMSRDDAFLCLERHATSKLHSEEDLSRLLTLGFRGEAIPSIAAVSRMLLRTRTENSMEGWEIYLEAGEVRRAGAAGSPVGTTVEVRNLFYNLPARRKFLRRDETEFGHIAEMITRLALAKPHIQFQLVHNGRRLIDVNRQKSLAERVADLLGKDLLKGMVPLDFSCGAMQLCGLISEPTTTRPSANSMFTYINGRYIRDRVVHHALREGYRNLIMKGRHPAVAVFLEMDPSRVDVNVHPTKHEVRFQDQAAVHDFIAQAVRETLQPSSWVNAGGEFPTSVPGFSGEQQDRPCRDVPGPGSPTTPSPVSDTRSPSHAQPDPAPVPSAPTPSSTAAHDRAPVPDAPEGRFGQETMVREVSAEYRPPETRNPVDESFSVWPSGAKEPGFFGSLTVIGQYRNSYILCQDDRDLLLIDQHAAHERIAFEKLKEQYQDAAVEGQQLLFPLVLEFDYREGAVIEEHLPLLRQLGFDLEPFGGQSFALKGVPRILAEGDVDELIRAVIGEIMSFGRSSLIEKAMDGLLTLMACHQVIRANQSLNPREIKALLMELDQVGFNTQCPHGRPVFRRITLAEVERMFKRT